MRIIKYPLAADSQSLAHFSRQIEHNSARIIKIISGGQTGVDRAALDVAIEMGFEYGGFCPKGRLAEDGIIQDKYKLTELHTSQYKMRTFANVQASDGTLIIHGGTVSGGTLKTKDYCQILNKPFFEVILLKDFVKIQLTRCLLYYLYFSNYHHFIIFTDKPISIRGRSHE